MTKVFVPGGFPTLTYVSRKEKDLEERVSAAQDYLSKLVVVTGTTKSGKTVLVDKFFHKILQYGLMAEQLMKKIASGN